MIFTITYYIISLFTIGIQVGAVGTHTVTDIVDDLPYGFYGMENLFMFCSFLEIPPEYGERFINKSDEEAGKCLEMFMEGYLVHKKGFRWCNPRRWCNQVQLDFDQDNSIFGKVVWELVKKIEPEADTAFVNSKLIEKPLKCYGVTGRADCIIQRRDKASIIIDFKYTEQNDKDERYRNPSRKFALQLLLYQWMVGKEFKEKEGAQLYIIRYYKGSNVMVLYQYQPPEDLQYSPAREEEYQPNVIDQVVENFKKSLQRHLEKENEFEALFMLDTDSEIQELQKDVCRKLQI